MSDEKIIRTESTMMSIPYAYSVESFRNRALIDGEFSHMLFAELCIDYAVEKIKQSDQFQFIETKLNKENLRLISVEYQGDTHDVFLLFQSFYADRYLDKTFLSDEEKAEIEKADAGLVAEIMFTEDTNKSYLFQLKLLSILFDDVCAVADISAISLCSGKWLKKMASSSVAPAPSFLYTVHAVTGDNYDVWLHTHGLNRCGLYEIEMLNLNGDNYGDASNVLSYLVTSLIANGMFEEYQMINIGSNISVSLLNSNLAVLRYEDIVGISEYDREGHSENYMTVLTYNTQTAYESQKLDELDKLLESIDNPAYFLTKSETNRMAVVAKESFESFLKFANIPENKGIIKVGILVDEEHRDELEAENREHLWFEFLGYEKETKTIRGMLENQPYFIKDLNRGDDILMDFDNLTDWIVYSEEIKYTPNNIYLYE